MKKLNAISCRKLVFGIFFPTFSLDFILLQRQSIVVHRGHYLQGYWRDVPTDSKSGSKQDHTNLREQHYYLHN